MTKKYLFVALCAVLSLTASVVWAQTTPPAPPSDAQVDASGISYPVPELGGCTDRNSCRAYCNDAANMSACIDFASKHGLMNKGEASVAKKFVKEIAEKHTPGGCTSPESCNAYCQEIDRLDECLSFAKEHGITDDNIAQGEQIKKFLSEGGKLPGGCTGKGSCESYCSDFAHATECTAFAKGAGFLKKIAEDQGMDIDQLEKIMELTASGQAPGGCKSKDQCESYCKDPAHLEECLSFGTKVGFMSEEQAQKIKEIGGKGPGGCNSESSCKAYCNDPSHRKECFQFGKEHNLIPAEDMKRAEEGIVQLKMGLEKAPPEMKACLNSVLGPDAIAEIQAGTFMPSPEIGDRMEECAGKFKQDFEPEKMFKGAPPEVAQCLKEKIGDSADKVISGKAAPDVNTADAFRVCMGEHQIGQGGMGGGGMPNVGQFLNGAPPEIQSCIKDNLGADFAEKVAKGEADRGDVESKMKDCFRNFRPDMDGAENEQEGDSMEGRRGPNFGGQEGGDEAPGSREMGGMPANVLACVKGKISGDEFDRLSQGQVSGEAQDAVKSCAAAASMERGARPSGRMMPALPEGIPKQRGDRSAMPVPKEGEMPFQNIIPSGTRMPSFEDQPEGVPKTEMMPRVPGGASSDAGFGVPSDKFMGGTVPGNFIPPSVKMPPVEIPASGVPQVPLGGIMQQIPMMPPQVQMNIAPAPGPGTAVPQ